MATAMRSMPSLLTYEEIAKNFDCYEVQDLKNPKPETMLCFYDQICKNLEIDPTQQLMFHGTEFMEDPELHRRSGQVIHLTNALRRILPWTGIKDFKVDDSCNPDPKRTRRILTNLITYSQYCGVKYRRIAEFKEMASEVSEKVEDLKLRTDGLKSEINNKQANLTQLRNSVKDAELSQQSLDELGIKSKEVQQEYEDFKTKSSELDTLVSSQRVTMSQNEEKIQELSRAIVQSPERVQLEMQQQIRDIEVAIAEQKIIAQDINALSGEREILQDFQAILVEVIGNTDNAAKQMKSLEKCKQQQLELEKNNQSMRQQVDEMPAKLEVLKNKMLMQQKVGSKQMSQMKTRIDDKKQQYKEREKILKGLQVRRKRHEKELASLDEEEDALTKAIEIHRNSIQYSRDRTQENLHTLSSRLQEANKAREEKAEWILAQLELHVAEKEDSAN